MLGLTDQEWQLTLQVLMKLGVGLLLAGVIGWEREMHGRPAGVRTHMLLVLGVILFSEVSREFGGDPSRIAAQIVTGVGFLCAGTILRIGPEIRGLTTAASLWSTAGAGMAVSVGGPFMVIAIAAVILSLVTLVWVDRLEERFLKKSKSQTMRLVFDDKQHIFGVLQHLTAQHGLQVRSIVVVSSDPEAILDVEIKGTSVGLLEKTLPLHGIRSASWQ